MACCYSLRSWSELPWIALAWSSLPVMLHASLMLLNSLPSCGLPITHWRNSYILSVYWYQSLRQIPPLIEICVLCLSVLPYMLVITECSIPHSAPAHRDLNAPSYLLRHAWTCCKCGRGETSLTACLGRQYPRVEFNICWSTWITLLLVGSDRDSQNPLSISLRWTVELGYSMQWFFNSIICCCWAFSIYS